MEKQLSGQQPICFARCVILFHRKPLYATRCEPWNRDVLIGSVENGHVQGFGFQGQERLDFFMISSTIEKV